MQAAQPNSHFNLIVSIEMLKCVFLEYILNKSNAQDVNDGQTYDIYNMIDSRIHKLLNYSKQVTFTRIRTLLCVSTLACIIHIKYVGKLTGDFSEFTLDHSRVRISRKVSRPRIFLAMCVEHAANAAAAFPPSKLFKARWRCLKHPADSPSTYFVNFFHRRSL